jgi:hypothetical protein
MLVGYTKHSLVTGSVFGQIIMGTNVAVGVGWYAVLIPTIVNRIARVR